MTRDKATREITMDDVEAIIESICAGLFDGNPGPLPGGSLSGAMPLVKSTIRYCLFNDHGRALFARAVVLARTGGLSGPPSDDGDDAIIEQAERDAFERCESGDVDEIRPADRVIDEENQARWTGQVDHHEQAFVEGLAAQEASTGENTDRIRVTLDKPAGYGPYLWALVWQMEKPGSGPGVGDGWNRVSVFTDYTDMQRFEERITSNGHKIIGRDLAVDQGRRCIDPDVQMNG